MKKIDLGQTITILANGAVLVGIELNQNRQMMQAQTRHEISQGLVDQLLLPASNGELAEILVSEGCTEDVTARCETAEQLRYDLYLTAAFRYWEDVHYQYRLGLYDQTEFLMQRENWRGMLAVPRNEEIWIRVKPMFSVEFAEEIDSLLSE